MIPSIFNPSHPSRWREGGATTKALKSKLTGGLSSTGRVLAQSPHARARAHAASCNCSPGSPVPPAGGTSLAAKIRCLVGGSFRSYGRSGGRRRRKRSSKATKKTRLTRLTVDALSVDARPRQPRFPDK
jgi:hypothetical protein